MAYPETCAGALSAMKQSASMSLTYSNRCMTHMTDAWAHWNVNNDHLAIEDILHGLSDANTAAGYAGYGYDPFAYKGPWWWYFTNCIEAGGIEFPDVIEAFINTKDDIRSGWVLLTDAYRASMYDKPFDAEYHALWIKRFRSWA